MNEQVNDWIMKEKELFLEDAFPAGMINALDPEKFPYHSEDLIGLPDETTNPIVESEEEDADNA